MRRYDNIYTRLFLFKNVDRAGDLSSLLLFIVSEQRRDNRTGAAGARAGAFTREEEEEGGGRCAWRRETRGNSVAVCSIERK